MRRDPDLTASAPWQWTPQKVVLRLTAAISSRRARWKRANTYEGKPRKALFSARLGREANVINFPLMEAALAGLWERRDRDIRTYRTSVLSLVISAVAVVISVPVAADWL